MCTSTTVAAELMFRLKTFFFLLRCLCSDVDVYTWAGFGASGNNPSNACSELSQYTADMVASNPGTKPFVAMCVGRRHYMAGQILFGRQFFAVAFFIFTEVHL